MSEELKGTAVVATGVPIVEGEEHVNEEPKVSEEISTEVERLKLKKAELEKQTQEAEEKAIYWRKEKQRERDEYFKGRKAEPAPKPSIDAVPKPKRDDFEDYDAYVDALTDWKVDTKAAQWVKEQETNKVQTQQQVKIQEFVTKLDEGYEKYPDFEDVVKDQSVPFTMMIRDILMETETPSDVAYYLGKNRLELIKINRMTHTSAVKEIERIEAELRKNPIIKPAKRVSDAPAPIKPLGSSEKIGKDPSKMTQKEYEQWANEKGMRRF